MFCTKCGNQLPDGSRFCTSCGAALDAAPVVEEIPVPAAEDTYSEPVAWEEPAVVEEAAPVEEPATVEEAAPVYIPQEQPVEKKSGKKRIVLIAVAAAVAVALLIGVIALIGAVGSPEAKLAKAAQKSGAEMEELLGNSDNFVKMLDHAKALSEEGELTAKLDYSMDETNEGYYSMSQGLSLQLSSSKNDKEFAVSGTFESKFSYPDYPEYGYDESYEFVAYASEKEFIASVPDVLDDAYSLPLKNLGEQLFESDLGGLLEDELDDEALDILENLDVNLFADTGRKAFEKAYPDEVEDFMDSLVVEKSDEEIPNADEDLKVYSVEWDMGALADMLVAYELFGMEATLGEGTKDYVDDIVDELEDAFSELEDYEIVAYAGISKGCLTALHLEIDDGYDDYSVTVVLEGKDNIWEEIVIYADEEEVLSGGFEMTGDGFEFSMEDADYGEELLIVCDDAACELTVEFDGEELAVIGYGAEEKGCQISYEYEDGSDSISVTASIVPMEKIEKPEDAINILELDEDELYDLVEEIEDSIG